MPAKSKAMQRLFGMALAYKRGELPNAPAVVRRLADSMSEDKLREYASTPHDNLPEHVPDKDNREEKQSAAAAQPKPGRGWIESFEDEDLVPVGVNGIIAATEKLVAVNRNEIPPDDRDSHEFKRLWPRHELFRERIRMDADGIKRALARNVAKYRSLKAAYPGIFDDYATGIIVGNPLTSPGEEVNPLSLLEQARRITQMGPGGIGDPNAITEEASNVHHSQFGFVSPVESPESERAGVDMRVAWGTKYGSDGKIYQKFFDRKKKKFVWLNPAQVSGKIVKLPD